MLDQGHSHQRGVHQYDRVAAEGELCGRGRRCSPDGLVPAGAFLTPRVREGIIEEPEEQVDGEMDARSHCLSQQSADGRLPDGRAAAEIKTGAAIF